MSRAPTLRGRLWLAAALATALVSIVAPVILSAPGVYFAQTSVVLLPDGRSALASRYGSTVELAGILALSLNELEASRISVSSDVTLLDEGIHDGWAVRQPASGSQWDRLYSDPIIQVQAAGATPQQATATIDNTVQRIESVVRRWEDEAGVAEAKRVRLFVSPAELDVTYHEGNLFRSGAALIAAAAVLAVVALRLRNVRWRGAEET